MFLLAVTDGQCRLIYRLPAGIYRPNGDARGRDGRFLGRVSIGCRAVLYLDNSEAANIANGRRYEAGVIITFSYTTKEEEVIAELSQ